MDITEQLRILQEAQGDPTKLVLASIDIVYPALLESEREILKDALKAAAISHWCDEAILATLLEVPQSEAEILLDRLRNLNVVESFLARGANAVNVHEATRLALRKQMASDQQIFFRTLTTRAQAYFETDKSPAGQIEWIYHFLIADPNKGATACEALDRQWTYQSHPEDRYALALALKELETGEFLVGRARIEALLCIGETRSYRGETAQLESFAQEILVQAQRDNYAFGAARANSLLGNCFQAQGQLDEAKVAFDETLRISRQLAEQDPSNVVWQRSLAVAYSRTGDVLQAQGQLVEAKEAFDEYLRISRQLAEQDPSNAVWQRGLAVAYSKTGDVLQAQGLFVEARAVYDECLRIFRQLAEQDPSNAVWQRGLAVARSRVNGVLLALDPPP
jgi:tetratricopeptide (TPR) repeat protein